MGGRLVLGGRDYVVNLGWQQVATQHEPLTHSCCTCAATMTQSWTKGKLKEQSTWIYRQRCQQLAMVPTSFPANVNPAKRCFINGDSQVMDPDNP